MPDWFQSVLSRSRGRSVSSPLSQDQVSAIRDNAIRVRLMVRARWILLFALAIYALVSSAIAIASGTASALLADAAIPLNALLLAFVYNFISDRLRPVLATVRRASTIQFVLDVIVVALVLLFTGGPESWLWVIYILIIFEAATIARDRSDVWVVAGLTVLAMTIVDWSGLAQALGSLGARTVGPEWASWPALAARYALHVSVLAAAAGISNVVIVGMHEALARAKVLAIVDEQTGCLSRAAFHQGLETEYERASRAGSPIYLLLVDIDGLTAINSQFGIDVGDAVITRVASTLTDALRGICSGGWSPNAVYRVSGEEFALVVVESASGRGVPSHDEVALFAELVRERVSKLDWGGVSVTVSVGAASSAENISDVEELLLAADTSLADSVAAGGNRTTLSWAVDRSFATSSGGADGGYRLEQAPLFDDGPTNPFIAQFED